jgi:hypothetical protein
LVGLALLAVPNVAVAALKHTELWQGACDALLEANESSLSCALSLVHELATDGAALSLTERIFGWG